MFVFLSINPGCICRCEIPLIDFDIIFIVHSFIYFAAVGNTRDFKECFVLFATS